MPCNDSNLRLVLKELGNADLISFFTRHPDLNLYSASDFLETHGLYYAPADIATKLKEECLARSDFRFFARVALYSSLNAFNGKGWGQDNYLLAGHWISILGKEHKEDARRAWDYLKSLSLQKGWRPISIYDPAIDGALNHSFPQIGNN